METNLIERLEVSESTFQFEFCRKRDVRLGPVQIDQFWMPVTELYGQRHQSAAIGGNHTQVINHYWALTQQCGAGQIRAAQERLLLASLLPKMRALGSRRIFADPFVKPTQSRERRRQIHNRNVDLSGGTPLTPDEFHTSTWQLLGKQDLPDRLYTVYDTLRPELFDEACELLGAGRVGDAKKTADRQWVRLMQSIGRRAGKEDEKTILDVLSYEARAAFHHAYSAVWSELIPNLQDRHGLSDESVYFHSFWHQDRIDPNRTEGDGCWSLFHGHVFALHPGGALFLQTAEGARLMGESLRTPGSLELYERLLGGLLIAMAVYDGMRWSANEQRRGATVERSVDDIVAVLDREVRRRTGRRRRDRPPTE